jgi:hypothetical protein
MAAPAFAIAASVFTGPAASLLGFQGSVYLL